MQFINQGADVYIPDGAPVEDALKRTNGGCLAIGAHQDDLEIFAMHGIGQCYGRTDKMFTGITVTNGSGSARKGDYASYTDEQLMEVRHREQQAAAREGRYAAQFQLHYKSSDIKGDKPAAGEALAEELYQILMKALPATVYIHNPFDKHETHNAVTRASLQALRRMPGDKQPQLLYGCEVWRGLDWMPDEWKVSLDVSEHLDLQEKLIDCHASQIAGSKNYTQATLGREFANATYTDSHALNDAKAITLAVDLRPLLNDSSLSLGAFVEGCVNRFASALIGRARTYEI